MTTLPRKFWMNVITGEIRSVPNQSSGMPGEHFDHVPVPRGQHRQLYDTWLRGELNHGYLWITVNKNRNSKSAVIELCSRAPRGTQARILWMDVSSDLQVLPVEDILSDNCILESAFSNRRIINNFDFGDGVQESRQSIRESGSWWVSPQGRVITVPDDEEHADYVARHPRAFGLTTVDVELALTRTNFENYIWNSVIRRNNFIRIAEYLFGYNITAPDLSNRTKNAIYLWASAKGVREFPTEKVSIDEYSGVLRFGNVGQYKTSVGKILKNFDFGDGVQESRQSIREATNLGYWITDKGDRLWLGNKFFTIDGDTDDRTHTQYLRINKLFSGDRFGVATKRGWIAVRYATGKWLLTIYRLDSRTRDNIWDWAKTWEYNKNPEAKVQIFLREGGGNWTTTIWKIVEDFDFGDGVQEARHSFSEATTALDESGVSNKSFFDIIEDVYEG